MHALVAEIFDAPGSVSFILSFDSYLMSVWYVPGTAINAEKPAVNKTDKNPCFLGVDIRVGEDKYSNKVSM